MSAVDEVNKLLHNSGAVLVRNGKHEVYKLSNGRTFTRYKTPSDHRTPLNELSDLRKALDIVKVVPQPPPEPLPLPTPLPPPPPEPPPPPPLTLRQRIEETIAARVAEQDRIVAAAAAVDTHIKLLKAILVYADEPQAEHLLAAVLPPPPKPVKPPLPPQRITQTVQVTRELVFAATQTFDGTFTINDVLERMTGSTTLDTVQRTRTREAVLNMVRGLLERGEIEKEKQSIGRQQTLWRKVAPRIHVAKA